MNEYAAYNDEQLLALLKTSDETAFTQIYKRYWDKLFFIAGTKLRDLKIAEELVQDVFLDLWNRREGINITGELKAYLAVAMKYKVINAQAKIKRSVAYEEYAGKNQPIISNNTEQWLSFEELKSQLEKLVSNLPERCQLTYRLSREEGLSHKEISNKLNISEKAVESNISRALQSLRTSLARLLSSFLSYLLYFLLF